MAEIHVIRTQDPIGETSGWLRKQLSEICIREGRVRLAIPGGSALAAFGEMRKTLETSIWKRVYLTWVDERRVPLAHPDSNRGEAYRLGFLDPGDPPGAELPLYLDDESPEKACQRVEISLQTVFHDRLDLLLLGLGEDGHIASLFPGGTWLPPPARVQAVERSPKPPMERISLSLSFLSTAPEAVILVAGASKQEALLRLLDGDPHLPASFLPRLTVVTDL